MTVRRSIALVPLARLILGLFGVSGVAAPPEGQSQEADQVIVLYNRNWEASRQVAEYYAERRHIAADRVFGFELPRQETISREVFETKLLEPLRQELHQAGLLRFQQNPESGPDTPESPDQSTPTEQTAIESSIRYAVLCYGIPVRIRSHQVDEPEASELAEPLQRTEGAVDSELAALPLRHRFSRKTGPLSNPVYQASEGGTIRPSNGVLMVSRLDGPDPDDAMRLVDRALEAEQRGLWGRAYFDARGIQEGTYQQGDHWVRAAARLARRAGFETVLDEAPETFRPGFPMSHLALYAGWYAPHVTGPFAQREVELMPGAVAYHLHSFSAETVRSAERRWVGPLVAQGVTATLGHVYEPYLELTPNIEVLFHRLMTGFNFGEASYAAHKVLAWQTITLGDPLYRPFHLEAQNRHHRLLREGDPRIEWSHLMVVNRNLEAGTEPQELIDYLQTHPSVDWITENSAVLLEKLADLYREQEQFSEAAQAYEKARRLSDSPLQRQRLKKAIARSRDEARLRDES